jgi:hypothetical protein
LTWLTGKKEIKQEDEPWGTRPWLASARLVGQVLQGTHIKHAHGGRTPVMGKGAALGRGWRWEGAVCRRRREGAAVRRLAIRFARAAREVTGFLWPGNQRRR